MRVRKPRDDEQLGLEVRHRVAVDDAVTVDAEQRQQLALKGQRRRDVQVVGGKLGRTGLQDREPWQDIDEEVVVRDISARCEHADSPRHMGRGRW